MKLPSSLATVTPFSKLLAGILFITLVVSAFYAGMGFQKMLSRNGQKSNSGDLQVFSTQKECERSTGSNCVHYLCDIPLGEMYQKICIKGVGSGWYNTNSFSDVNETTNWKAYTSNKFKYSIKYPLNWSLKESPYGDFNGTTVFLPSEEIYDNPDARNRGIAIDFRDTSYSPPPPNSPTDQKNEVNTQQSGYQRIPPFYKSSKIRSVYIKDAGFEVDVLEPNSTGSSEKYLAGIRYDKYEYLFYFGKELDGKYDTIFDQILSTFRFATSQQNSPTPPTNVSIKNLFITEKDNGKSFVVNKTTNAYLRLSTLFIWSNPELSNKSIQLIPVNYLRDPGFSEWAIQPTGAGSTTISSSGTPNCPTPMKCPGESINFKVTIIN